ncbi:MAG: MFS transporter [Bdellovibrionales bacterium]|nr:MFS transporter [Bdellovibrionales bacterium]
MYRGVILLTVGQAVSQFGSSLTNIALVFWIKNHFNSGTALGLFYLSATLSAALISLAAGPLIDRFPKLRLLVVSDLVAAGVMLMLCIAFLLLTPNMWSLTAVFVGKILLSILYGIRQPALGASIYEVTDEDTRQSSNSIFSSGRQLAMILSESVSGVLYAALTLPQVMGLDLATYLAAAILVAMIAKRTGTPIFPSGGVRSGFRPSLAEGWRFVRDQKGLLALALSVLVINVFYSPFVVWTPFLIEDVLQMSTVWFGYATAAVSLGILLGSNGGWFKAFNTFHRWVYFGILISLGTTFLAVGLTKSAPIVVGLFFTMGVLTGAFNVKLMGMIQACVEPQFHGRVFSLLFGIGFLLGPAAKALSGILVDMMDKRVDVLFTASGISLMITAIVLSRVPSLNVFLSAKRELPRAA